MSGVRQAVCPRCDGSGQVATGEIEAATGAPVGEICEACRGEGYLDYIDALNIIREMEGWSLEHV